MAVTSLAVFGVPRMAQGTIPAKDEAEPEPEPEAVEVTRSQREFILFAWGGALRFSRLTWSWA